MCCQTGRAYYQPTRASASYFSVFYTFHAIAALKMISYRQHVGARTARQSHATGTRWHCRNQQDADQRTGHDLMQKISDTDVWRQLADHHRHLGVENLHIKDLFAQDLNRVKHLTLRADTLVADLSRHLMTAETWQLLHSLADQAKLSTHIQAMFDGEAINRTEQRPALHVALRGHSPAKLPDAA